MNNPFLSIIVPVYKAEKYLSRCIDSILSQSYKNFELILVDDGSPDNSSLICDEYVCKDSRVRVIHKENEGVGVARNTGLEHAFGQWILFIDSDDYINQGYFEKGVYEITCNKGLDCVIFPNAKDNVETRASVVIDNIVAEDCLLNSEQMFHLTELFEWSSCIYSKFYKKELLDIHSIRFAKTPVYEDVLFNMTYFMYVNNIQYVNKYFYHYMIYPSVPSLTRSIKKPNDIMVTSKAFLELFEKLKGKHWLTVRDKQSMQSRFFKVASWGVRGIYQLERRYSERVKAFSQFIPVLNSFALPIFSSLWLRKVFLTSRMLPFAVKDFVLLKMSRENE